MNDEPIRVLLVDDDPDFRRGLTRWLRRLGYQVDAAAHCEEALRRVAQNPPYHVALIDFALEPGPNGIEVMQRIKRRDSEIAAVIFTGFGLDPSDGLKAMRAGAYRYLPKSTHREEIDILIRSAADHYTIRRQLDRTTAEKEKLEALDEARQRKLAELGVLNEIGRAIAATVQMDDLPRLIYEQASRVIDTSNFLVALYDRGTRQLDFVLRYERGQLVAPHRDSVNRGLTGYLVRQRRPLLLRNIRENEAFRHEQGIEPLAEQARSWLGAPILSGVRVMGAIIVRDYGREDAYGEDQLELLQIIANYAAVALENARLFAQVEETARQLTMLHRITTHLQNQRIVADQDCMLNLILTGVTAGYGLGFDRAAILLLDEARGELVGRMGIGHLDKALARQTWERLAEEQTTFDSYVNALLAGQFERTPLDKVVRQLALPLESEPLAQRALQGQHAIHVTAPSAEGLATSLTQVFDPHNCVIAPLVSGGEPIGLIVADDHFSQGAITENRLELFNIFANEAAIAIENARLNEETGRRMRELDRVGQAARAITMSLEQHEVLRRIVTLAAEVAHSDHTSVVLVKDGELIDSVEDFGARFPNIPPLHQRARHDGQTRKVVQSKMPVFFDWVEMDDPIHNPCLLEAGLCSYAGLPLQVKEEIVGVLFVHSFQPNAFQESIELLTIFAHHAAIAIANARLFQNVQARARARDALVWVAQQITSAITDRPKAVLESIAQGACAVTGADCAVIYPYLAPRRAYDARSVAAHGLLYPGDFSPSGKARERGVAAAIIGDSDGWRIIAHIEQDNPQLFSASRFIQRERVRAFVGVRLDTGEEPTGVLFVNWRQPHRPSDDELDLIKLLSNYAAIAIQNARLYELTSDRLQRRVEELEHLHQIDQQITAAILEPDQVFELILKAALELTEGQRGELWSMGQAGGALELKIAQGERLGEPGPTLLPVGQGVAGKAARGRRLWLVPDVRRGFWARIYPRARSRVRSVMAVPLLVSEQVLGAIVVESTEPDAFGQDEQRLLERLAAQAVIAIQNTTQYQAVERQRYYLEAIYDAAKAISASLDLDLILNHLLEHVRDMLGTDECSIALRDEKTGELTFVTPGPVGDRVWGKRLERGQGVAGWVAEHGQPTLVLDTSQDLRFFPGMDERTGFKSDSILCVPMSVTGRVIGVIEAVNLPDTMWAQEQMETLNALAGFAALAIENARQFEEIKSAQEETAAAQAVAWMGIFGSNWAHGINQRTFAIRNYLATLRELVPLEEQASQLLDWIEEAADEIQSIPLTSQLPVTAGVVQSPVEIDGALRKQVEKWSKRRDDVERVYHLQCAGALAAIDQEWLDVALEKLINNALKAMGDGGRLDVASEQDGESIFIHLTDTGPGIPVETRAYFLKQPVPHEVKAELGRKGTGVGVLIARLVFRRYGGELKLLWSEQGKGTTLRIILPRAQANAPGGG